MKTDRELDVFVDDLMRRFRNESDVSLADEILDARHGGRAVSALLGVMVVERLLYQSIDGDAPDGFTLAALKVHLAGGAGLDTATWVDRERDYQNWRAKVSAILTADIGRDVDDTFEMRQLHAAGATPHEAVKELWL